MGEVTRRQVLAPWPRGALAVMALSVATAACSLVVPDRDEYQRPRPGGPCSGACGEDDFVTIDDLATPYRIAPTEVTNAEYQAFLADAPTPATQTDECAWNESFVPADSPYVELDDPCGSGDYTFDPTKQPNLPVTCVDWCDATAYCKWAGKRLCGRIGGGAITEAELVEPELSQWYRACSRGGTRLYPYGSEYAAGHCNTGASGITPVRSFDACQGGYDGIYDMSGNVLEWEDNCALGSNEVGSEDDRCTLRGGAFWGTPDEVTCDYIGNAPHRNGLTADWGFRCCSD